MIGFGIAFLILSQQPEAAPPAPRAAATRDGSKRALEDHKKAVPRLPMPPEPGPDSGALARVNNGRFRAHYIPEALRENPPASRGTGAPRAADPAFTLDNTFKVKLFWISSRANDCFY